MNRFIRLFHILIVASLTAVLLIGCSGSSGGSSDSYIIKGDISGLDEGSMTLTLNDQEDLVLKNVSRFEFTTKLDNQAQYKINISNVSDGLSCAVLSDNASGKINSQNVSLSIHCQPSFSISGSVKDLSRDLVLVLAVNNVTTETLTLSAGSTSFTLNNRLLSGDNYTLTTTPATDQNCSILTATDEDGTSGEATDDNISLQIICEQLHSITTNISGLPTGQKLPLTLQFKELTETLDLDTANNGPNNTFITQLSQFEIYNLTFSDPNNFDCDFVINGTNQGNSLNSQEMGDSNVTYGIACFRLHTVKVTVEGLHDNASLDLNIVTSGPSSITDKQTFSNSEGVIKTLAPLKEGSAYTLTINNVSNTFSCNFIDNNGNSLGITFDDDAILASVDLTINCSQALTIGGEVLGGGSPNGLSLDLLINGTKKTTFNFSGNEPKFVFDQLISPNQTYQIIVASNPEQQLCKISDGASGTVLQSDIDNVLVNCRTWSAADLIAQSTGTGIIGAKIVFLPADDQPNDLPNAKEDALVVWRDNKANDDHTVLRGSRYIANSDKWVEKGTLSVGAAFPTVAQNPVVGINGTGPAITLWQELTTNTVLTKTFNIYSRAYSTSSDEEWSQATPLTDNHDENHATNPSLAVGSEDFAVAVWKESLAKDGLYKDNRTIITSIHQASSWSKPTAISSWQVVAKNPKIAADNNSAIAVWQQASTASSNSEIYVRRFQSNWKTRQRLSQENINAGQPEVAIDPRNGDAIVVWTQDDGSYASRYSAHDDQWEKAEQISNEDQMPAADIQIAFDKDGNALAVWQQERKDNAFQLATFDIYTNRYIPGNGWQGPQLIEPGDDQGTAREPQLAFDVEGNALVVWLQLQSHDAVFADFSVFANRYSAASNTWDTVDNVRKLDNDGLHTATQPKIAFDAQGNAMVIWAQAQTQDGPKDLWYSRFE